MRILKILHNKSGNVIVDTTALCLVAAAVIALGLTTFSAVSNKYTLIQTSNNVKRIIETDGKYDTAEQQKISQYLNNHHLTDITVSVSPKKDKYQLNEEFTVTLTKNVTLGLNGGEGLSLPLKTSAFGSCEVFSK